MILLPSFSSFTGKKFRNSKVQPGLEYLEYKSNGTCFKKSYNNGSKREQQEVLYLHQQQTWVLSSQTGLLEGGLRFRHSFSIFFNINYFHYVVKINMPLSVLLYSCTVCMAPGKSASMLSSACVVISELFQLFQCNFIG